MLDEDSFSDSFAPSCPSASPIGTSLSVLAIGDSFFDFLVDEKQSIPDETYCALQSKGFDVSMTMNAVGGTQIPDIINQYLSSTKKFDWVMMTGGGNDVNDQCDCGNCDAILDNRISSDSTSGLIPEFVTKTLLPNGHKVVYLLYPDLPDCASGGFENCADEIAILESRLDLLSSSNANFFVVKARDVIPIDPSYFVPDCVHPNSLQSSLLGPYIAETIATN